MSDAEPIAPPHAAAAGAPASPRADAREQAVRLAQAKRRVAAIKGFYVHLGIFAAVVALLFAINAASGGSWWVQWVVFGWGIGVVAHALAVFWRTPRAVADWEERKVKEYAQKQR